MNWLLLVVLAFLVFETWYGLKRGFIKTVFALCSFIVTIVLTVIFSPVITKNLQSSEKVVSYFAEKVRDVMPIEEIVEKAAEKEKETQNKIAEDLPLPESIIEMLVDNNEKDVYQALGAKSFEDYICNSIACMVISALSFVVTFLIIAIALKMLCTSLDLISKLPVLNEINKFCGMILGFIYGMMIVWLFCIVVTAISSTSIGSSLLQMIGESQFLNFIYTHNLIVAKITDLAATLLQS